MISSIHIENVAVIRSLDIDLRSGFTAITGQTGAGKSIIIDSIALTLGAKAQTALIRTGETRAYVSMLVTDVPDDVASMLAETGIIVEDGEMTVERTVSSDGKSTAKVNGRSISLSNLRRVMSSLVAVNGQSESLSLKTPEAQLALIDEYAKTEQELTEYAALYEKYSSVKSEYETVKRLSHEGALAADLLKYQIKEIDAAKLSPEEEEELTIEKARLKAGERITKLAAFVYRALYGNEKGASAAYLAERAASATEQLAEYSRDAAEDAEKLRSIAAELEDIARRTYSEFELDGREDEDPAERLERIEDRLDVIHRLKRKYGGTVAAVLAHRDAAADKLDAIENNDERIAKLEKALATSEREASESAARLTEKRKAASKTMSEEICRVLAELDMPKVTFDVNFTKTELSPSGDETAEFYISANAGEDVRPLATAASGGELSRVMLAIKSVENKKSAEETLIYDEIDTGVSGSTSGKIGLKLKESARTRQIIAITHSAQIASLADTHLLVEKHETCGRTETVISDLTGEARIDEIARIIGGINVTETQKKAARELISEHQN